MPRHLTLVPVVDYEPAPGPVSRPSLRGPRTRRPAVRHTGGPAVAQAAAPPAATAFADTALRTVLEVIDRRRPVAQLRPLGVPTLIDGIAALARSPQQARRAAAVLRTVRLQVTDGDARAAEVFATFSRGERVRAIAGRVELVEVRGARRWQLVALQLG